MFLIDEFWRMVTRNKYALSCFDNPANNVCWQQKMKYWGLLCISNYDRSEEASIKIIFSKRSIVQTYVFGETMPIFFIYTRFSVSALQRTHNCRCKMINLDKWEFLFSSWTVDWRQLCHTRMWPLMRVLRSLGDVYLMYVQFSRSKRARSGTNFHKLVRVNPCLTIV